MKIACVFGTRPEIIKFAPIVKELERRGEEPLLIHTGQHYDYEMSDVFIKDLGLPLPRYNLGVGSGTAGEKIAKTIVGLEKVLVREMPDLVLVQGDTSIVPSALFIARRLLIPSGHVEAGLRSFNLTSPEEINRRAAAPLAILHFAPTQLNKVFLRMEGVDSKNIYVTGNTIVDVIRWVKKKIGESNILQRLGVDRSKPTVLVTAHRPSNVDRRKNLETIFNVLLKLEEFTLVFPIHPRTEKNARKFGLLGRLEKASHIVLTKPLGYVDFLALMAASDVLLTDSGGLQEEACEFKKPVVVMRETTPRWEAVLQGIAFLTGVNEKKIVETVERIFRDERLRRRIKKMPNPYGNGKAGKKIVDICQKWYRAGKLKYQEPTLDSLKDVRRLFSRGFSGSSNFMGLLGTRYVR